ncbi:YcaO-like family protein [Patescibacteria group bacterium]|nr:YcaO-like family protein [Patescibacteria group bacterium]
MLKNNLIKTAANFRHGIVLPPQLIPNTPSDIEDIFNVGVPQNTPDIWASASGGIGRSYEEAELAAIGEAVERYAAGACELPKKLRTELKAENILPLESFSLFSEEQRRENGFPYSGLYEGEIIYTNIFSLYDNSEYWAAIELVTLNKEYSKVFSTSSGLAAGASPYSALLRALQEVIERDALMITWLHSIPGRQASFDTKYKEVVESKGGTLFCIDATPKYSPFPVVIMTGTLPIRGKPRVSLGCACRETYEAAVEKAFLEWSQGIIFAGYYSAAKPGLVYKHYNDIKTFDDHAVYYTIYPEEWGKVVLIKGEMIKNNPNKNKVLKGSAIDILTQAIGYLQKEKIRIYYRDLTTHDLRQIGVYSMRVLSPDLSPIFCHQKYPFLGGRIKDVYWRYPWAKKYKLHYPNPMPHPLG